MSLLSLTEAANELGGSLSTLRRIVADGDLAVVRVRGRRLIDPRDLKSLGFAAVPVRPRLRVPLNQ